MYILIKSFYDYRSDISVLDISLIINVLFRYAWALDSATINCAIFWDFLMFYQTCLSPQVKRCAIITYKHDIYKLLNDLRLSLVSMSHPSAQSPRQIENFANASKKPLKNRNQPPPNHSAPPHTNTTAGPKYPATGRSHSNSEVKRPYWSISVRNKYNSLVELENTPSRLEEAFYAAGSPMEEKKYDRNFCKAL